MPRRYIWGSYRNDEFECLRKPTRAWLREPSRDAHATWKLAEKNIGQSISELGFVEILSNKLDEKCIILYSDHSRVEFTPNLWLRYLTTVNKKCIRRNFLISYFSRDYGDSDRFAAINILVADLQIFFRRDAFLCGILSYYATRAAAGIPRNGSNLSAIRRGRVNNSALVEILSISFARHFSNFISFPSSSKNAITNVIVPPCLPQNLLFLNQIFNLVYQSNA